MRHGTEAVLDRILTEATQAVGAKAGYIRLLVDGKWVVGSATESAVGYLGEISKLVPEPSNDVTKSLAAVAMSTNQPAIVEDATTSEVIYPKTRAVAGRYDFHGTAAIPVRVDDQPVGVMIVFDDCLRAFTENELSILTGFAQQASTVIANGRLLS